MECRACVAARKLQTTLYNFKFRVTQFELSLTNNLSEPSGENIQVKFHFFGSLTIGYARNPSLNAGKNCDAKLVVSY